MHGLADPKIYVQPLGFLRGYTASEAVKAGQARWLAGGPLAFTLLRVISRRIGHNAKPHTEKLVAVANLAAYLSAQAPTHREEIEALLERICRPRPPLACGGKIGALDWDRPLIQGIVNVTPDSFSDGGKFGRVDRAVAHAMALIDAGADIIDIGGESTRPGALKVSVETELKRVIPVVERLAGVSVPISVDTRNANVMAQALRAGAHMINDVSALTHDGASLDCLARHQCPIILMHAQNDPQDMQDNPSYDNVVLDVYDFLEHRIHACLAVGIARKRLIIDPGIGFGKTVAHNIALLTNLSLFHGLGQPILLGASRKGFIGAITGEASAPARVPGSLAVGQLGYDQGVHILRVHDVADTKQAHDMWCALEAVETAAGS